MKKLLLILVLAVMCSSIARAGSYEDDGLKTKQQQAEAEAEEYTIMMEDAEDDHNNGIENTDSDHSLEDHSNHYDY